MYRNYEHIGETLLWNGICNYTFWLSLKACKNELTFFLLSCYRGHSSEANGLQVASASPRALEGTMMVAHTDSEFNNNHALIVNNNNEASPEELALLAKLEEANR